MAFEDITAEIRSLFDRMTNRPQDMHELAAQVRELLGEMRATGMPLPEDLVALEAQIEADEAADASAEHDPLLDSPGPPPL